MGNTSLEPCYHLTVYRSGKDTEQLYTVVSSTPFLSIHIGDHFYARMFAPSGLEAAPLATKFSGERAVVTSVQHALWTASSGTVHHELSIVVADPLEIED